MKVDPAVKNVWLMVRRQKSPVKVSEVWKCERDPLGSRNAIIGALHFLGSGLDFAVAAARSHRTMDGKTFAIFQVRQNWPSITLASGSGPVQVYGLRCSMTKDQYTLSLTLALSPRFCFCTSRF